MKFFLFTLFLTSALPAVATITFDKTAIKPEDQKFYKNDPNEGKSNLERMDSAVKEINKLHGEIAALKAEMNNLKKDVELLKKSK